MANTAGKFDCYFRFPEPIDIDDVAATRKVIIDLVNDPGFEILLGDLRLSASTARGGPAPRGGGEFSVRCDSDFSGHGRCEAGFSYRL